MKHYITLNEAADICGVSTRTIRNWIASNELKAYSLGKRLIRIDYDELRTIFIPMNGHLLNEARSGRANNRRGGGF